MAKIKSIKGLPFKGSKSRALKYFYEVLDNFSEDDVFVDLFGGSLILSAAIKNKFPNATIICNDYDNQILRYKNIERTQEIMDTVRSMITAKRRESISEDETVKIREYLRSLTDEYIDWYTIGSYLLFSGTTINKENIFNSKTLFNMTISKPLSILDLEGVVIESADYKEILKKYPKAVYIADPPYMSTDCTDYKNDEFWTCADSLSIPYLLGDRFIYYEGERSEIKILCKEVERLTGKTSPFRDCKESEYTLTTNVGNARKEYIFYKNYINNDKKL